MHGVDDTLVQKTRTGRLEAGVDQSLAGPTGRSVELEGALAAQERRRERGVDDAASGRGEQAAHGDVLPHLHFAPARSGHHHQVHGIEAAAIVSELSQRLFGEIAGDPGPVRDDLVNWVDCINP